jgi:hypothetical protein
MDHWSLNHVSPMADSLYKKLPRCQVHNKPSIIFNTDYVTKVILMKCFGDMEFVHSPIFLVLKASLNLH